MAIEVKGVPKELGRWLWLHAGRLLYRLDYSFLVAGKRTGFGVLLESILQCQTMFFFEAMLSLLP